MVEDHADTAESTALILRLYGHDVHIARDGPSALLAAQVEQPDVVLLDIGLPATDGYEVAKVLRKQETKKRPLLISRAGV